MNPNKIKNKKSDNNSRGQNQNMKTDIINLDKPMNSISSNNINFKNHIIAGNNNNLLNNNDNLGEKLSDLNIKQNGYDASKNNIKAKQEDISIVDITKGGRIITDLEINYAPVLLLEVIVTNTTHKK
jgi:hypothetical protein